MKKNILFVCTGNTCRSPMAEALLRQKAGNRYDVRSAGISALAGQPAAEPADQALAELNIPLKHRSRPIDKSLVEWADLILTMTQHQKAVVGHMVPESLGKVFTLKEYAGEDDETRKVWAKLERCYAELETERALSHEKEVEWLGEEIQNLENALPSYDISDPFGGSVGDYRRVCQEISSWLESFIEKEGTED